MSVCETCGREYQYDRSKGGTKTKCNSCCTNRRRYALKPKVVAYMGGKCARCGYDKCLAALVPHHLRDKKFNISGSHARSWKSIRAELDKCVLLCQNCHAEEHHDCERYSCGSD